MTLSRRGFLGLGAAAATSMIQSRRSSAAEEQPAAEGSRGPVAIASANGLRGVAKARELMAGGADPLDAAIAGVVRGDDPLRPGRDLGQRRRLSGERRSGSAGVQALPARHQTQSEVFYSAYPRETVLNIIDDREIARGVGASLL